MNRKQLILLVVVGVLLGGLALMFNRNRDAEFQRPQSGLGGKLLGDFPTADITHVRIRSRDGQVNLVKDGVWVVEERSKYPAAFGDISGLVRKLWELKAVQSQKVGMAQWGRLDLLAPDSADAGTNTALRVELLGRDGKSVGTIHLGRQQMRDSGGGMGGFPVGRWVSLPGDTETVYLVSEAFSEVQDKPETWLNKDFFKVEKLRSVSLVSTNEGQSWTLTRTNETSDWVLAEPREGETLDKSKISGLNWAFSSPSFSDVEPQDGPASKEAFEQPTRILLETFEGFRYALEVGTQPDPDSYWLKVQASAELPTERVVPADETEETKAANEKTWSEAQDNLKEKLRKEQALRNWVYKVSKWTVDSVLKDRSALLAGAAGETAAGGGEDESEDMDLFAEPPDGFPPLPPE
jgi:hypothetical protein